MKLSLNWIKEYITLPSDLTMEQLAHDLTMRTVEVEGIVNPKDALEGIVVGVIISLAKHPAADLLTVCQVDAGQDHILQIVCGGQNLYVGQKVAVSVPGAMVRWHGEGEPVEIKVTELRGVKSEGMICGANELDLEQLLPAEGERSIIDLKDFEAKAGDPIGDVLGLDDMILEIDNKSMTNRPDLWGHYGMARELATIYGSELGVLPKFELPTGVASYPVAIESDRCMRYVAAVFDNLDVRPAPFWMQKRLWSVGLRPINNLVDITNYVMMSTGQPTHGFDRAHVPNGIVVRQARSGEMLELLDDTQVQLDPSDLLITDGEQALALAGVMGGKKDSILLDSSGMVLEVAAFNALGVRRTSKRHNVRTESATRYEKNIDTARVDQALGLAQALLKELAPEATLTAYGEAKTAETVSQTIELELDFLNSRIGREVTAAEVRRLLAPLGFEILDETASVLTVHVPVWRSTGDVSLIDDLLEEVARMIGYENLDYIAPSITLEAAINQREYDIERKLRETLALNAGFQEIFTYPWIHEDYIAAAAVDPSTLLELEAPPSPEERYIRGSLVPGMLEAVVKNLRYFDSFRIFELAQIYQRGAMSPSEPGEVLPYQQRSLCAALVGPDAMQLFREAKGVIESLPVRVQFAPLAFAQLEKPQWADPKMWLNVLDEQGAVCGHIALLSIATEHAAGIKHQLTVLIELNVEMLHPLASRGGAYEALPLYPEVWEDMNVVVSSDTKWSTIETALAPLVLRSRFTEEYYGKQLPEGTKSIIFRYWIGSNEGTLTAADIEARHETIVQTLAAEVNAKLRS